MYTHTCTAVCRYFQITCFYILLYFVSSYICIHALAILVCTLIHLIQCNSDRVYDMSMCVVIVQRLGSATLPFTVLSLAINPCAEDYLAVCGLKVMSI